LFGEITPEAAYRSLDVWSDIVHGIVVLIPEDHDLPAALKLALELNHPLQDCIYLALAERFDAPLVTADEKFAAKAHARYPRVRLLSQSPAR
jgi:predicted nucleic acid-binding protein